MPHPLTPRRYEDLQVSVIIPAYNEAKNIVNVLAPLRQVTAIREIIVVSDGSTDGTAHIAREFGGVRVIELPQNLGKTKAVLRGVFEAQHPALLLIDADLINLRHGHILDLLHKYCEGWDMVIMDKGSQSWVFRRLLKSMPALSGTRILDREHLLQVPFRAADRFQFENRINHYFLRNHLGIAVSPAEEIHDPRKFVKYPFWTGLLLDLKGGWEVMALDGVTGAFRNLGAFHRIRRLADSQPPRKSGDNTG